MVGERGNRAGGKMKEGMKEGMGGCWVVIA